MAITQVRAKLGDTWTTLTYNAATGRYEGTITPPGTSIHQPEGYYSLTAEATNSTGQVATLTGEQYAGLRLVVRETAAPVVTLLFPAQGWLTTASPAFVFQTQDEAGGSGIDPDSIQAAIDGAPAACAVTESGGVYTITIQTSGLSEGPHTAGVTVSDYDGNQTTASGAWQVDTVPPVIIIGTPDLHRVVDWEEVTVSGYVRDATSGVAEVKVNGETVAATAGTGEFSAVVPLAVGVNEIPVSVTDTAGNTASLTVWMLRLITDRIQADVDAVNALAGRNWDSFSAAEKAFWMAEVRGAYNDEDMNRVGTAVAYISQLMSQAGYLPGTNPKTDWNEYDGPTPEQRQTYLDNVAKLQALAPVPEPKVPPDMEEFRFQEANDIETILVGVDRIFPLLERSAVYSGEGFSGEF